MKKLATVILLAGLIALALPNTASADPKRPRIDVRFGFEVGFPAVQLRAYSASHGPCRPYRVWVPGRYEWQTRERHLPGRWILVREAPVYRTVTGYSGMRRTVLTDGGVRRVWEPGRTERFRVRVWVPGHWRTVIR